VLRKPVGAAKFTEKKEKDLDALAMGAKGSTKKLTKARFEQTRSIRADSRKRVEKIRGRTLYARGGLKTNGMGGDIGGITLEENGSIPAWCHPPLGREGEAVRLPGEKNKSPHTDSPKKSQISLSRVAEKRRFSLFPG